MRARLGQLEDAEGKWKRTEEALRQSERDKSLILGSLSELITYQDKSLRVVWANKAAGDSVGQSPEELVGRYCYEIWHGRDEPCRDCPVQKSIETGQPQQSRITSPDGRVWNIRGCPVLNEQGDVVGVVEVTLDITKRKWAEETLRESEQRFRDIAENALEWIWEVDVNGKYTYTSSIVEKILGYKAEEVLEKHFYDLFHPEDREELKKEAFEVFAKKQPFREYLNRNVHKNGKTIWLLTSGVPILDENGNFLGYRGADVDITERKRAAETLRESENLLQTVINSTEDAMISIGEDGLITLFNPAAEVMFGRKRAEMIGQSVDCLMPKEYRRRHREYVENYFSTGKPDGVIGKVVELSGLRRNGNVFPMAISLSKGELDNKQFVIAVARDITERKQAEEQLRIRDKAIESSISAMAIAEPGGNLIYVNPAFLKMWGYDDFKEVIGKPAAQFWQFEDMATEVVDVLHAKGKWTGEMSAKRKDGTEFDVQIMASIVKIYAEKPVYMMASFIDITERKRTEKTLLASEARYRMVVEDQTELICRFMPEGVLTFVNDAYCRYFGRKREELVGHSFMPLIPGEDRNKVNNQISQLNKENSTVTTEHRVIDQGGSIRWQQWTNRAIFDEQGNIIEYQAVGRDVGERKEAAEALEYRMNFEKLITSISTNFINLSAEEVDNGINQALKALGEFTDVDRSYVFQFFDEGQKTSDTHEWSAEGITPQIDNLQNLSVDSTPWWMSKLRKFETIHIPDVKKLPASAKNEKEILRAQSIKSLIVIPMVYNRQLVGFMGLDSVRRKRTWSQKSITLLTIVSEIFVNTLMRRRAQQQLSEYHEKMFRAEQLASLGTVSATIAHELNQPLTVMQLFLQQGLRALKDDNDVDKVAEVMDDCLGEVTKAASTVDRFRRFARKSSPRRDISEVNPVEIANRITGVLAESARRSKLNLSVDVKNHPPQILGNVVEFEQIFFVLIQNAIQAADGETWQDLKITISSQNGRLQLTFADTCGGIEQENINKIFEPFFTTKPANIGTGLGLCILERIVKKYNGSVRVDSQPGQGTIFYISLSIRS